MAPEPIKPSRLISNPSPEMAMPLPAAPAQQLPVPPKLPETPAEVFGLDLDRTMFCHAMVKELFERIRETPVSRLQMLLAENKAMPIPELNYCFYLLGQYEQELEQRNRVIQLFGLTKRM